MDQTTAKKWKTSLIELDLTNKIHFKSRHKMNNKDKESLSLLMNNQLILTSPIA